MRFHITIEPLIFHIEGWRSLQEGNAFMAILYKPFHGFNRTVVQVTAYRMNVFGIGHPVEEHHGNFVVLHLFKVLDMGGAAADRSNNAINAMVLHTFYQLLFAGQVVVALANKHNVVVIERYIFNAIDGG